MEKGELPSEPELALGSHRSEEPTRPGSWPRDESVLGAKSYTKENEIEEDEFFGEDNDSEDS